MSDVHEEFPGPTAHLVVTDAERAVRFYRAVFGADELLRNSVADGRVMHCELLIFGGRMLLTEAFEQDPVRPPEALGGTTVRLHLYVPDVDQVYRAALAHGATSITEPVDAFWGDRYAVIRDPSGHVWSLATPHTDVSVDEQRARAAAWAEDRPQDGP